VDELFFAPPDFEAALAMLALLPARTTVDSHRRFRNGRVRPRSAPNVPLLFSRNKWDTNTPPQAELGRRNAARIVLEWGVATWQRS
jgi:hypothetical protein